MTLDLYEFLPYAERKIYFEELLLQTVDGSHLLFFFHTMEVNGYHQLFVYQHSSK